MHRSLRPVLAALSIAFSLTLEPHEAMSAEALSPQFIAKMYTEALGRLPDASGWDSSLQFFAAGCTATAAKTYAKNLLTSSEFLSIPYDSAARTLVLYRSLLNREPSASEFSLTSTRLAAGQETWGEAIDRLLASSEFAFIYLAVCLNDGKPYGWNPNFPAIAIAPVGSAGDFSGGTSSELQALLNQLQPGDILNLNQKAVIFCDSPIIVPAGVQLATFGISNPRRYALMARLVRVANFRNPIITLAPGAALRGIWVDGQVYVRINSGITIESELRDVRENIRVRGRTGVGQRITRVRASRSSNSAGGTHLSLRGSTDGPSEQCGLPDQPSLGRGLGIEARNNLVTAYATRHSANQWSDGISVKCENSLVIRNQIVDATDGGIIVFNKWTTPVQRSRVVRNQILAAGNSAFYGLGLDAFGTGAPHPPPPDSELRGFDGTQVYSNTLWTSSSAHFDVALTVGQRILGGDTVNIGRGAKVLRNSSFPLTAVTNNALVVNGMRYATVLGNTITPSLLQIDNCAVADVAAAVSANWASGTLQSYVDETALTASTGRGISACVGGSHAQ